MLIYRFITYKNMSGPQNTLKKPSSLSPWSPKSYSLEKILKQKETPSKRLEESLDTLMEKSQNAITSKQKSDFLRSGDTYDLNTVNGHITAELENTISGINSDIEKGIEIMEQYIENLTLEEHEERLISRMFDTILDEPLKENEQHFLDTILAIK